ncbi:MAG TPA: PQQ-binding-like beta-propeller repeat protein [Chloroflexota bacterium]|nr:PQQ-binding-like beta-propeller repeat protein [Chloroflexota bacterium]
MWRQITPGVLAIMLALAGCSTPVSPTPVPATAPAAPAPTPAPALTSSASAPSVPGAPAPPRQPGPPNGGDWPTYHRDPQRSGVAAGTFALPAGTVQWQSDDLDGAIYAQPLLVGEQVILATESDSVYALDAGNGQVRWRTALGDPVPQSALPCGNIDPVGITSTPVVDAGGGVVYAVAFLQPPHHELVALDLATGALRYRQPIDPPGADPHTQLQRAALALSQGKVYVSYGGRLGDCGAYHGWVVSAQASDGSLADVYQVPTQREGAIWATGGPSLDGSGNLYVATGNGSSDTEFDFGNAVIRLGPDLQAQDWFAPSDWATLNRRDLDLGSTGPALLDNGLVFQIGKSGTGYLLRADALGHVGGQLFAGPVCNGAYGETAHQGTTIYVPCRNGLHAVHVGEASFAAAWQGPAFNAGPPIVVGDTVWTVDEGTGALYALAADDGTIQQQVPPPSGAGPLPHFIAPAAAAGRLVVARGRSALALGPAAP